MTALLVFLGGMLGAALRYTTDRAVQRRHNGMFPRGTLVVNTLGSLVLGAAVGAENVMFTGFANFLGLGFAAALTTYSTFSHETLRLLESRARWNALLNVLFTVLATVGAVAVGFTLTRAVFGG